MLDNNDLRIRVVYLVAAQFASFRFHPGWGRGADIPPSLEECVDTALELWEEVCRRGLQAE